jgi:hypothetical protein
MKLTNKEILQEKYGNGSNFLPPNFRSPYGYGHGHGHERQLRSSPPLVHTTRE